MKVLDTAEGQERLLEDMGSMFSFMAYNEYLLHGRGVILIHLKRCLLGDTKFKGCQYVRLGRIHPIDLFKTVEMVETYDPSLEYVIGFDASEEKLGSRVWICDLVMLH